MTHDELMELFDSYDMGSINIFDFIVQIHMHNISCNMLYEVDSIHHAKLAVYAYQSRVVIIKLAD